MPNPGQRDLFAQLGLTPIINVSGTETVFGAAPVCAEVLEAVAALAPSCVEMTQLQEVASVAIAAALGCEAGAVTHCTAAGIAMAVAGSMTGEELARIHQLPDTTGMRNEIVLQRGHSIDYGAPLRQAIAISGAKVIEIGTDTRCTPGELAATIGAQTAAAIFVVSHHTACTGMIELSTFCQVCRDQHVPVIVDAAAEPDPRLFLAAGADLVVFSVHKRLAGLTSAIVAGKSALVRSCLAQEKGIGRPMKAGKEAVIGAITALARWQETDQRAAGAALDARLRRGEATLARVSTLHTTIVPDATSGLFSRLHVQVQADAGLTALELAQRLRSGSPAIIVREAPENRVLQLDFRLVSAETVEVVTATIADIMNRANVQARPEFTAGRT